MVYISWKLKSFFSLRRRSTALARVKNFVAKIETSIVDKQKVKAKTFVSTTKKKATSYRMIRNMKGNSTFVQTKKAVCATGESIWKIENEFNEILESTGQSLDFWCSSTATVRFLLEKLYSKKPRKSFFIAFA